MKKIRLLNMELFGGCNYSCQMCPQGEPGRESEFKKLLPLDVYKKVLDDAMNYGLEAISLHGSGEPTLSKNFIESIQYAKSLGLACSSFTNGYLLTEDLSEKIVDSGLDVLRISVIGYDKDTYEKWMKTDSFERVLNNASRFNEISKGSDTELHSYHLILDNENVEYETSKYRKNWIEPTNSNAEIWMMHNWSGVYNEMPYSREGEERSCGRPFNDVLEVRAGGLDGHNAAVVACCMTLGDDSSATLGHLDESRIIDVLEGGKAKHLRNAHASGRWNDIDYCKGCDQLYEAPESLIWSNIEGREYNQSKMINDLRINVDGK
jgi:pyruvate-formate lyase-activating enzyme